MIFTSLVQMFISIAYRRKFINNFNVSRSASRLQRFFPLNYVNLEINEEVIITIEDLTNLGYGIGLNLY
jgi:hypothetical protein